MYPLSLWNELLQFFLKYLNLHKALKESGNVRHQKLHF